MPEVREPVTSKPLQRISWSEKQKNKQQFFKDTADFYIRRGAIGTRSRTRILELYKIYNNEFATKYFKHIMDPLSAKKAEHRNYPARMRSTGILRTNLDLLMGEYPRRSFVWQVTNMGEDGYNSYTEALTKKLIGNITQHFIAQVQQEAQASGVPVNQVPTEDQVQLPDSLAKDFKSSYKDDIAIKAGKWLKRAMKEYAIRPQQFKMFKDYLITGLTNSYKTVDRSSLIYEQVSPMELQYDQYDGNDYIEDKEWVVRTRRRNISDIVDMYYDEIKNSDLETIEKGYLATAQEFYTYVRQQPDNFNGSDMVNEYHVVWKGKVKKGLLYYIDPLTGETQQEEVDEDYKVNKDAGEVVDWFWANQWYETTRIGGSGQENGIYLRMRPVPVQRNEMNNLSKCKGPYNGRSFSNTETENISVLDIGLPFQLMHMIVSYTLEKTIAKSKGKIFLFDKNAIPKDGGWDEEKFFYYADALGYALMNRNQPGVDKSMNQYHVVDMTLFDSISQLITLMDKIKQQWDDILGITRQRKGQTYATDSVTNNESATFQSTVITDNIFAGFEEFIEKEFQGILDLSKFINIDGVRKLYNNDDFGTELLEIDPIKYTNADLGIYFNSSTKEKERFDRFKENVQALIQNGAKPSTVMEIVAAESFAELKQTLLQIEEIEDKLKAQQAQAENDAEKEKQQEGAAQIQAMEELKAKLKVMVDNNEWDRRDENEMIKGEVAQGVAAAAPSDGPDANAPVPVDPNEMAKRVNENMKALQEDRMSRTKELMSSMRIAHQEFSENMRQQKDLAFKYDELEAKERMAREKNATDLKNKVVGESKKKKK